MPREKGEEWKNFNSDYLISNYGRWYSKKSKKILKQFPNSKGYMRVKIYSNGLKKDMFTHLSVIAHFGDCNGKVLKSNGDTWLPNNSPKDLGLNVDHLDRNKHNNSISNLEIVTHSENMKRIALVPEPSYIPDYSLGY